MKIFFRLSVSLLFLPQLLLAQQTTGRTIFLVRHAEKTSNAPDATLTSAGQQRADCLAQALKDAGIKSIFVSDLKRTQLTAAPLAKALNLKPNVVPAKDPNSLVRDLFYGKTGNALVVGHGDTLPLIITRLQAGVIGTLNENDYDKMFVLTVLEGTSTPVTTLHYCAASPRTSAPEAPAMKNGPKPKGPTQKK